MWLNGTSQSALRAVLYIAGRRGPDPVRVDEIAAALGAPRNYLSKTLHGLAHAGVLRSTRGPRGGFRLADPPDQLVLARIIAPFEPVAARRCLIGRPNCGREHPCLAHHRWERVAGAITAFFDQTTVADLLAGGGSALEAPLAIDPPKRVSRTARRARRR